MEENKVWDRASQSVAPKATPDQSDGVQPLPSRTSTSPVDWLLSYPDSCLIAAQTYVLVLIHALKTSITVIWNSVSLYLLFCRWSTKVYKMEFLRKYASHSCIITISRTVSPRTIMTENVTESCFIVISKVFFNRWDRHENHLSFSEAKRDSWTCISFTYLVRHFWCRFGITSQLLCSYWNTKWEWKLLRNPDSWFSDEHLFGLVICQRMIDVQK